MNIRALMMGSPHRMSHVYRYSSIAVLRRQHVAEHTFYVSFYALNIAYALIREGFKVCIGKLLERAIVHDIDESHTGDFLRTVKYGTPGLKEALDGVSSSMMLKMVDELDTDLRLYSSWLCSKVDDLEGHILEVADLAEVGSYVLEEIRLGNRHVAPILSEVAKYISQFMVCHSECPTRKYAQEICLLLHEQAVEFDCAGAEDIGRILAATEQ